MAAYRFEAKIISRSSGRSAVHAASHNTGKSAIRAVAYRMRENLVDERTGQTHDYSRKFGGNGSDLFLPDGTPSRLHKRQDLWNEAEKVERRKDAQLARDFVITLPYVLNHQQHRALIKDFVSKHFVSKSLVADVGYHAYGEPISATSPALPERMDKWKREGVVFYERDQIPEGFDTRHVVILRHRNGDIKEYLRYQPHAHVMVPLREMTPDGFAATKIRPPKGTHPQKFWKQDLDRLREGWADAMNVHLEAAGSSERVDHRSLSARGIDRKPEPKKGPIAAKMERDGRGHEAEAILDWLKVRAANDEIRLIDSEIIQLEQQKAELSNELKHRRREVATPEETEREKVEQQRKDFETQPEEQRIGLAIAENRTEESERLLKQFEIDREKGKRQQEELEREQKDRLASGDIPSAEARWITACSYADGRRLYTSLASAATMEGDMAGKEYDQLTKEAALAKTPDERNDALLRRDIMHADYMALTSERLGHINRINTGNPKSFQANQDMEARDFWREEGELLREERKELKHGEENARIDKALVNIGMRDKMEGGMERGAAYEEAKQQYEDRQGRPMAQGYTPSNGHAERVAAFYEHQREDRRIVREDKPMGIPEPVSETAPNRDRPANDQRTRQDNRPVESEINVEPRGRYADLKDATPVSDDTRAPVDARAPATEFEPRVNAAGERVRSDEVWAAQQSSEEPSVRAQNVRNRAGNGDASDYRDAAKEVLTKLEDIGTSRDPMAETQNDGGRSGMSSGRGGGAAR